MLRWPDSIYYFSHTQQTQEAIEGEEVTAGEGERGGEGVHLLGHPARPTPKAAVALSWQQPYTDRLQCWSAVSSGSDVAEIADEGGRQRGEGDGRWHRERGKNSNI